MSAEELYHQVGRNLPEENIEFIENFYSTWEGQDIIPIKFRFVKLFALIKETRETKWFLLHQLTNKRRITNKQLPSIINGLINNGIIPLRIFQSTTEWLAPNEVFTAKHHHPRLINSGFIPFENDDSLEISLATACKLVSILQGKKIYVFSGNKSIHTWFFLENISIEDATAKAVESAERNRRYSIYNKVQKQIPFKIDNRITADTRRVVPIINSLNAFTGRKVVKIDEDIICQSNPEDIYKVAEVLST